MEEVSFVGGEWRRLVTFSIAFFVLTPITLVGSLLALNSMQSTAVSADESVVFSAPILAALPPQEVASVTLSPQGADARAEIIYQYLKRYDSPLTPHASFIVEISDEYRLDFRLLPAIAQQESNLCKKIPEDSFNCWGWGIHKRGTLGFQSFEEGIEVVARGLRQNYLDKGLQTPEEIMSKYTPSSPGTWSAGVTAFMSDME